MKERYLNEIEFRIISRIQGVLKNDLLLLLIFLKKVEGHKNLVAQAYLE